MQVDVGGRVVGAIEFATVDAEELQSLVEVGGGELGLQELRELRELGEVDTCLGCRYANMIKMSL